MIDLRTNYFGHARWFFGAFVALFLTSLLKDRVIDGAFPHGLNLWMHAGFVVTAAVAGWTRSDLFHRIYVWLAIVVFCLYIALLFARLQA